MPRRRRLNASGGSRASPRRKPAHRHRGPDRSRKGRRHNVAVVLRRRDGGDRAGDRRERAKRGRAVAAAAVADVGQQRRRLRGLRSVDRRRRGRVRLRPVRAIEAAAAAAIARLILVDMVETPLMSVMLGEPSLNLGRRSGQMRPAEIMFWQCRSTDVQEGRRGRRSARLKGCSTQAGVGLTPPRPAGSHCRRPPRC